MTERKAFLNEIRRLEKIIEAQAQRVLQLENQISLQGNDTLDMAEAAMQIRQEDVESLAIYKKQNTALVCFIEKVADSKSKFRKEARQLLGF